MHFTVQGTLTLQLGDQTVTFEGRRLDFEFIESCPRAEGGREHYYLGQVEVSGQRVDLCLWEYPEGTFEKLLVEGPLQLKTVENTLAFTFGSPL
ncbi:MAG: hypothetical protein M9894_19670 [Planctomycetes bacterium]|nr:hypothetical protein [Planctomycetota bacterium]